MIAADRSKPGAVTRRWIIYSKSNSAVLGQIQWYSGWRQYVFFPAAETLFNDGCLRALVDFLADANAEHQTEKENERA